MAVAHAAGYDALAKVVSALKDESLPATATAPLQHTQLTDYINMCIDLVYACNFQCLLLSGWGKHNSCVRRLQVAKTAYATAMKCVVSSCQPLPPLITSQLFPELSVFVLPESLPPPLRQPVEGLHALFTHTLFYAAQTYANLSRADKSARYVEATLQRQLDLCGDGSVVRRAATEVTNEHEQLAQINAVEWAKNALRLSEYFIANSQFTHAVYCLTASDIMIGRMPVPTPGSSASLEFVVQWGAVHVLSVDGHDYVFYAVEQVKLKRSSG